LNDEAIGNLFNGNFQSAQALHHDTVRTKQAI
jgi:hypothetical protein